MTQRIINDTFWTDPYIEDLDPSEKLIFLYLLSNPLCNIAGAYEIKTKRIAYETWFDKDMIDKILNRFKKDNKILRTDDWIIIVNFAKNQSNNPNVLKWMQRIIDGIPIEIIKALKGFERLPYFTLLNLTLPNLTYQYEENFEIIKTDTDDNISKDILEQSSEIVKVDKRDLTIDIIVETLKEINMWVIDDTVKKQRQYWKLLRDKMKDIKWFNWDYVWFIKYAYDNSDEYRKNHFRSLEKFYYNLANIIAWLKIQNEKKPIRRWC